MSTSLDWPEARLGLPSITNYGIEPQDAVARTDMDSGPARQRRRWTTTPTEFPVTFKLSRYQLAIFEGWFDNFADAGAAYFNITLLSGVGLASHEVRFKGKAYKANPWNADDDANAEWWRVTAVFEARNRPVLDEGMTALLIDSDFGDLIAAIDASIAANGGLPPAPYYWQWS